MRNQWIRRGYAFLTITASALFLSVNSTAQDAAPDGKALFGGNCASCHKVFKDATGPALRGAQGRWADAGEADNLYEWVKGSADLAGSGKSARAKELIDWSPSVMTAFPALSNEEIDAIFAYVDGLPDKGEEVVVTGGGAESVKEDSNMSAWLWICIGIFLVIAMAGMGVKRKLAYVAKETEEEEVYKPFGERMSEWFVRNFYLGVALFVVVAVSFGADQITKLGGIGVFEDYQPSQAVQYPHDKHAGDMGIDCKYCHNSAEKSKHAGIPTTNVCMNCHASIHEGAKTGTTEIAKLHAAAGYDAEKKDYNRDAKGNIIEGTPIVWNKAHNLPDHVFFSHAQHVNPETGNIDCRQCHGPVETYTLGRVSTVEEINAYAATKEGKEKKIEVLTKPLLTMGWCLECHDKKTVNTKKNDYYREIHERLEKHPDSFKRIMDDDKVTARELGGWECAKCHY